MAPLSVLGSVSAGHIAFSGMDARMIWSLARSKTRESCSSYDSGTDRLGWRHGASFKVGVPEVCQQGRGIKARASGGPMQEPREPTLMRKAGMHLIHLLELLVPRRAPISSFIII